MIQVVQNLASISVNTDDISVFHYFKDLIQKNFSKVLGKKYKIFSFFEESEIPQRKYFLKLLQKRCADYVLKDKCKCLNVFIHADMPSRVERVIKVFRRTDDVKKAERLIKENDRMRARHYRYYTDGEWGDASNYHITLNTSAIGVENCAKILKEAYLRFDEQE